MHPMYQEVYGINLRQGDILDRDIVIPELRGHHDYFVDKDYFTAFCVITQTCDLVRRKNGTTSADFVTLAVVREITHAFSEHLPANTNRTKTMLEKIINHNWNPRAYFYLHPNEEIGLDKPSVVDLRVTLTISLYPEFGHYEGLLKSRRISLEDGYAASLGWMAGHLFSRVSTNDWDDLEEDVKLERTIKDYVNELYKDIREFKQK